MVPLSAAGVAPSTTAAVNIAGANKPHDLGSAAEAVDNAQAWYGGLKITQAAHSDGFEIHPTPPLSVYHRKGNDVRCTSGMTIHHASGNDSVKRSVLCSIEQDLTNPGTQSNRSTYTPNLYLKFSAIPYKCFPIDFLSTNVTYNK